MGWKKLLSDPPGEFECLPGKVRAWATLLYRYAYADGTIRCPANPNALAMLARVHVEERKHWPRIVRDLEAAGILLCCKDEDCWRL